MLSKFFQWQKLTSQVKPADYQEKATNLKNIHLKQQLNKIVKDKPKPVDALEFQLINSHVPNNVAKYFIQSQNQYINRQSIATEDNFHVNDYLQISIIPILLRQIRIMLGSFLELEIKIDPQTNRFYHNGFSEYVDIVNESLKKRNVIDLWQYCCLNWMDKEQVNTWVIQILKAVEQRFKKYNFLVDQQVFYQALTNQLLRFPYEQNAISAIQTKTFGIAKNKMTQRQFQNAFKYQQACFKLSIQQKRAQYNQTQYFFFQKTPEMDDFNSMIIERLQSNMVEE